MARSLNCEKGPTPNPCGICQSCKDLVANGPGSLLGASAQHEKNHLDSTQDYRSWLVGAYGENFSENYPMKYTRKYWRTKPELMSTDWIGQRMFMPSKLEIIEGTKRPQELHYINKFRYPRDGGYTKYFSKSISNSNLKLNSLITGINLS